MSSTAPLIQLRGLSKVFHTETVETRALQSIDLSVRAGEFVAITGPSGCGKSTLLSILGLLEPPSDGTYLLAGEQVSELSERQRANVRARAVGFVFQAFNLLEDLDVAENVELPLTYRDISAKERREMVKRALDRVGLLHRARHRPSQLSGGQQQRAAVARAIAGAPTILLADEPTGNLDSANGRAVMELLAELHREGRTVCMVTHDERYLPYATRVVELFDGALAGERAAPPFTSGSYASPVRPGLGATLR